MSNGDDSNRNLSDALEKNLRGRQLLEAGSLESAVAAFAEAIRLNPDMDEAYRWRAAALNRIGRAEEAKADLEKADSIVKDRRLEDRARGLTALFWVSFGLTLAVFSAMPFVVKSLVTEDSEVFDFRQWVSLGALVGLAAIVLLAALALRRSFGPASRASWGILVGSGAGILAGGLSTFAFVAPVPAEPAGHVKLVAGDAALGDQFGDTVSVSGDIAVIGAPENDDVGTNSGSAYVFVRGADGWTQQVKLVASDSERGDRFGEAVAVSGKTVVVGVPLDDDVVGASGSVHVFVRSEGAWNHQAKLIASDSERGDRFGQSVAMSGDNLVVGAAGADGSGANSGSAYVLVRTQSTWTEQAKLTARDAVTQDRLGESVAISGDTVVAGAPGEDDAAADAGAVYVFVRSGSAWTQQAKLVAGDATAEHEFGSSVAISGDTLVVGAAGDDERGTNAGAAYVFVRSGSTWSLQAKLTADDAAHGDSLGRAVAIFGDVLVVGARWDDDAGPDSGSAYVFVRNGSTWTQLARIFASDAAGGDFFGGAVAVGEDAVVVGAPQDDDAGGSSGSAYVFEGAGLWLPESD